MESKRALFETMALAILLSFILPNANAFSVWDGHTLCANNLVTGDTCYGSVSITSPTYLTSDLNMSGNLTLYSTLYTNGYSIAIGSVLTFNGGVINAGQGATVTSSGNGQSNVNSYGASGGGAHASGGGTDQYWCGGSTRAIGGCDSVGLTPSSPSVTNPFILNILLNGIQNYLAGAEGGNAQACNIYQTPGAPGNGIYIQSRSIVVGSLGGQIITSGGDGHRLGCTDGNGYQVAASSGGGGAGSIILAVNKTIQDPTYTDTGGNGPAGGSAYAGGSGSVTKFSYTTPPVPTPFIVPQVANVLPKNVLATNSVSFTINVIQTTNPIKNVTIFWGDGNSNIITSSSTNDVIAHTYAYAGSSYSYTANVFVCDINFKCNYTFSQAIHTFYTPPSFNSISPRQALEANSVTYTINVIQGNFTIKNTTIQWGDGTYNVITSNALSNTANHIYSYIQSSKPDIFNANIIVCDINLICSTSSTTINGIYTVPSFNSITPSKTYSTLTTAFTFNMIKGNYSITNLQVNWGDGNTVISTVNTLSATLSHDYLSAGNYIISAIAIDQNTAPSNSFTKNVLVAQYVLPFISQITPSSVANGNSITYSFTAQNGTFAYAVHNSIIINFGTGSTLYANAVNGANHANFIYPYVGNFSVLETITDINGKTNINTTLISVSLYPWNFIKSTSITYNVTNVTTQRFIQTNQTDIFPVNYTLQNDNIVNNYLCSTSISSGGLFSISCVVNPNSFSYVPQTLLVTIFAKDTQGVTKSLTETINLVPKSPAPSPPTTPFSTNSVKIPLPSKPFIPPSAVELSIILAGVAIAGTAIAFVLTRK